MYLVCGEALYDVFVGDEAPGGGLSLDAHAGGSPFNVAIGLARLGSQVGFLGGLSRDQLGKRLHARLGAEGVDRRFLVRMNRPTTLSLVSKTAEGTPAYTFYGAGAADRSLSVEDLPVLPQPITGLHFGSYSIVAAPTADALVCLAEREAGKRLITLDPNVRPAVEPDMKVWRRRIDRLAKLAALIKVSKEDLALLWPGKSADAIARRWLDGGAGLVVVTKGEYGAMAYTDRHFVGNLASKAKVVDTVGAGDSFQAALLHALASLSLTSKAKLAGMAHPELIAVLAYASRAAAITCSRRGADLPRATDLGPPPAPVA
jgi:fructokinase